MSTWKQLELCGYWPIPHRRPPAMVESELMFCMGCPLVYVDLGMKSQPQSPRLIVFAIQIAISGYTYTPYCGETHLYILNRMVRYIVDRCHFMGSVAVRSGSTVSFFNGTQVRNNRRSTWSWSPKFLVSCMSQNLRDPQISRHLQKWSINVYQNLWNFHTPTSTSHIHYLHGACGEPTQSAIRRRRAVHRTALKGRTFPGVGAVGRGDHPQP